MTFIQLMPYLFSLKNVKKLIFDTKIHIKNEQPFTKIINIFNIDFEIHSKASKNNQSLFYLNNVHFNNLIYSIKRSFLYQNLLF
jgi:hypothetical protein